jgi:hypothetical protein
VKEPGNGNELGIKTPWGSLSAAGRDVVLLTLIIALGAGLIGMQLYTGQRFEKILIWGIEDFKVRANVAGAERAQMTKLLRLRICSDAFFVDVSRIPDRGVREAVAANWREVCLK